MYCHNCGKKISDGSLYCENCGTKLNNDNTQSPGNSQYTQHFHTPVNTLPVKKFNPLFIVLPVCAIIIIVLTVVLIFVLTNNNENRTDINSINVSTPASSNDIANNLPSGQDTNDDNGAEGEDIKTPAPSVLSSTEARELAQTWLTNHPMREPDVLLNRYDELTIKGEEYYHFTHIAPEMYWFSILVHKETGALYCMLIEDGEDPGPPVIEPLDEWYDSIHNYTYPTWELYYATLHLSDWIRIIIYWYNDEITEFVWDRDNQYWTMYSRTGSISEVHPEFIMGEYTLEIHFPTTSRVYYLYDNHYGSFGNEDLVWDYYID